MNGAGVREAKGDILRGYPAYERYRSQSRKYQYRG